MEEILKDAVALGAAQAPIRREEDLLPFAVVPPDYRIVGLADQLKTPAHVRQTVQVYDADSFNKYFTDYVQPDSRIFVDIQKPAIVGVLDYHRQAPTDAPIAQWGHHTISFVFRYTREWNIWTGSNKKQMSQADFAQFIEDNLLDVVEPSHGHMTEISRTLEVKKGVNFSSSTRLSDGQVQFGYEEEVRGTVAKGTMEVPETFKIRICPFEPGLPPYPDGAAYVLTVRLRYRIKENGLTLWYELVRPHKTIEDAVAQIVLKIKAGVNNPITLGSLS